MTDQAVSPMRLLLLIRSLEQGGAERQLVELANGLDKTRLDVTVATFYDGGILRTELEGKRGIRLISLHKRGRWDVCPFLWRLWRTAREVRPHVVHGYMTVANELALLIGRTSGAKAVAGLRSSHMDFSKYDWAAGFVFKVGAVLSRFFDLTIVNSWAGQKHHIAYGYDGRRMFVVPNGIDTGLYRPDQAGRQAVRAEWKIADHEKLIGLVGRLDPMKDHPNFMQAAAAVAKQCPEAHFVCVGNGPVAYQERLIQISRSLQLEDRLLWTGARIDMPQVYNALDVLVSASSGEGFPNVIAEAMSCGLLCVVTDVGDSARIVGTMGIVVPPRNPDALAGAILQALAQPPDYVVCHQRRERIIAQFDRSRLASTTTILLEGLCRGE